MDGFSARVYRSEFVSQLFVVILVPAATELTVTGSVEHMERWQAPWSGRRTASDRVMKLGGKRWLAR
ncbi:MAG: hypothetical protein ACE5IJ_07150 [Thermoplasmata archaeon]